MAHMTVNQYLQQVDEALQQGRGQKAAVSLFLSCFSGNRGFRQSRT
ncbi:unnamed protein product [Ixodes pacificus]